jgi:insertion element IS1 protein InsB
VALSGKKRQKLWLWIALDRDTRTILAWHLGSRGKKSLKVLLSQIQHIACEYYATDKWKIYRQLLPKEKLIQSKKETSQIESKNNLIRHYLPRFHRKTHCYSKAKHMVQATIALFV